MLYVSSFFYYLLVMIFDHFLSTQSGEDPEFVIGTKALSPLEETPLVSPGLGLELEFRLGLRQRFRLRLYKFYEDKRSNVCLCVCVCKLGYRLCCIAICVAWPCHKRAQIKEGLQTWLPIKYILNHYASFSHLVSSHMLIKKNRKLK